MDKYDEAIEYSLRGCAALGAVVIDAVSGCAGGGVPWAGDFEHVAEKMPAGARRPETV